MRGCPSRLPSSNSCGAPGFSASSGSSTNGSTSYWTSISFSARLGGLCVHGRHRRHRFTREADPVVQRVLPVAPDHDLRRVLVGDDGADARQRLGLARVDADDARVRMRAAQHARDEHARQVDVAGVLGAPGDALDGVDVRTALADDVQRRRLRAVVVC